MQSNKKGVIFAVCTLLVISIAVLVYGILNNSKKEVLESSPIQDELPQSQESESLSKYFAEREVTPENTVGPGSFTLTDPFRDKCLNEGGTYGTVCYY